MNEGHKTEGGRAPALQTQQPQASQASPHAESVPARPGGISEKPDRDLPVKPGGGAPEDRENANPAAGAAPDEARFTAGVVQLYEALLKEPIPAEMLQLVEKLGKQERK